MRPNDARMGFSEAFDITTAPQGAGPAYGNVNNFNSGTGNANRYRAAGAMPIILPDGSIYAAEIAYPATGGTGKSTAGGPAPDQVQRVFASKYVNPTAADQILYTVTNGKTFFMTDFVVTGNPAAAAMAVLKYRSPLVSAITIPTLSGAASAGSGTFPAIGNYLYRVVFKNANTIFTGSNFAAYVAACTGESAESAAVNVAATTNQVTLTIGAAPSGSTLMDIYRSAAGGAAGSEQLTASNVAVATSYVDTGAANGTVAIPVGVTPAQITNIAASTLNGDSIWLGQTLDIEDPTAANYEAVIVTAVTRNASGIVNGFYANFTKTHAQGIPIGVPLSLGQVNSTKGIEIIGQETQPNAPPGSVLAINLTGAVATWGINVAGFEQ